MSAKPDFQPELDADFWGDEPGIFDEVDDALEEAKLARAEAQIAAGKGIPHEKVAAWLKTWGTPEYQPPPKEWFL